MTNVIWGDIKAFLSFIFYTEVKNINKQSKTHNTSQITNCFYLYITSEHFFIYKKKKKVSKTH